ncbi:MAG: potassium transporter TrkG, partial [Verrucomicrobiota bacterium]
MNFRIVLHVISWMLMVLSLAIATSLAIGLYDGDPGHILLAMGESAGGLLLLGAVGATVSRGPVDLSNRDSFAIVTVGWLAASGAGALPYLMTGVLSDIPSAVFESMSGFTTTGASVLTRIESLPRAILFWRSLTQWLGGMGVLVLCVAILPFLGVGGIQIYRAEMPGPTKDRLTPRIATTAKLLWGVYVLLTLTESALLRMGGMNWFDAVCHAFATVSTGGFSTRTGGMGDFNSVFLETVIILFMFLSGMNFALHFRALRG